jgi:hypothetical protein
MVILPFCRLTFISRSRLKKGLIISWNFLGVRSDMQAHWYVRLFLRCLFFTTLILNLAKLSNP